MGKNVLERMAENGAEQRIEEFKAMQCRDYAFKKAHAEEVAWKFYEHPEINRMAYVAVGGLDSITLLCFLRSIGIDIPAVSVSVLEDKSIQHAHKELGVTALKPLRSKVGVVREFGWPVLSKEIAGKISLLQHPSPDNATVRHAIITGETGEYGGYRKDTRMKLSQIWLDKFGGADAEGSALGYDAAPFLVSDKCCYYLKEKPCDDYAKQSGRYPMMGLMASEGGRRQKALMLNGCNYISPGTKRSAPFAIFSRQDVLRLNRELGAPVPEVYGEIVGDGIDGTHYTAEQICEIAAEDPDRFDWITLKTTLAQRTGCSMCGFGITLEKRPHRFDILRKQSPKEWEFWMKHVMQDENGEWYGWGRVLDYIGVGWDDDPFGNLDGQISMFQEGGDMYELS